MLSEVSVSIYALNSSEWDTFSSHASQYLIFLDFKICANMVGKESYCFFNCPPLIMYEVEYLLIIHSYFLFHKFSVHILCLFSLWVVFLFSVLLVGITYILGNDPVCPLVCKYLLPGYNLSFNLVHGAILTKDFLIRCNQIYLYL